RGKGTAQHRRGDPSGAQGGAGNGLSWTPVSKVRVVVRRIPVATSQRGGSFGRRQREDYSWPSRQRFSGRMPPLTRGGGASVSRPRARTATRTRLLVDTATTCGIAVRHGGFLARSSGGSRSGGTDALNGRAFPRRCSARRWQTSSR